MRSYSIWGKNCRRRGATACWATSSVSSVLYTVTVRLAPEKLPYNRSHESLEKNLNSTNCVGGQDKLHTNFTHCPTTYNYKNSKNTYKINLINCLIATDHTDCEIDLNN
jgi:hypothetical protein